VDTKNWFDIVSFIASIASLVLAILAIWFSWVFYKESAIAAKSSADSAKEITAAVSRLEKLFESLYNDTFSMMRDTYSDMRKHIWHAPSSTETSKNEIQKDVTPKVRAMLADQDGKSKEEVADQIAKLLTKVARKTKVSKRSSFSERRILEEIDRLGHPSVKALAQSLNVEEEDVAIHHLFKLRSAGKIDWRGPSNTLESSSRLKILPKGRVILDKGSNDENESHGDTLESNIDVDTSENDSKPGSDIENRNSKS
jgi:hypothetical protein